MTQVEMILAEHEPTLGISEIADLFWAAVEGDWLSGTLAGDTCTQYAESAMRMCIYVYTNVHICYAQTTTHSVLAM
jgi:hypothetical protein